MLELRQDGTSRTRVLGGEEKGYGKGKGARVNPVEDEQNDAELDGGDQQRIEISDGFMMDPTAQLPTSSTQQHVEDKVKCPSRYSELVQDNSGENQSERPNGRQSPFEKVRVWSHPLRATHHRANTRTVDHTRDNTDPNEADTRVRELTCAMERSVMTTLEE